ncbi:PREDICTED: TWiK family of potassium channels protein 7 isoform X2 [Drosophila arizonae]|uniref:TWiK family of potassium channels protein 7 isoform X2 n=1 Tax=Drosophila arizonae TaxID=7263 RepID=A0ABM1PGA2_DROAR|nr:PREDICTED: TWiK family of potassium channels protein 7 isoform X2 [Drosophila arizonae]
MQTQQTATPSTPPPSRRSNRPPRINIHNIQNNYGTSPVPPSAQLHTPMTNYTAPNWPPMSNPFGPGNFMTKGYEGFLDLTKSGLSFGEKFTFSMYNKFSKWSRRWFTHMFLLIILALYNIGGAKLFQTVEHGPAELEIMTAQYQKRAFFRQLLDLANTTITYNNTDHWDGYVNNILNSNKEAVESLLRSNLSTDEEARRNNPWSFWNAMVYSCTVYTTIGYGHITPKTQVGRGLTIIYAIIGIPMFLIVLADLGKLFTRSVKFLWAYVRRVYYTRSCRKIRRQQQVRDAMTGFNTVYDLAIRRPSMFFGMTEATAAELESQGEGDAEAGKSLGTSHPETPTSPYLETFEVDDEFNLPISVATMLLIVYILLGSAGYTFIESDWSFFGSFYFVFISMSTIGFGDLVPANPFYVMVSMIYLIFGLALTSMFINVVQIKLSDHFKRASAKVGATIGMNMASEFGDGSQVKTPSEFASVHGSRLGPIEEDSHETSANGAANPNINSTPPLTSILRPPRPLSPATVPLDTPPPLLPRQQPQQQPPPAPSEGEAKKKYRFF